VRFEGFISAHALIGQRAESRSATGYEAPIISQHATIEAFATVDAGTIKATRIDADAWIFKHAHIGHDAHIMERAEISTGAIIGGHCIIGPGARIGLNATVLPWKVIGARAIIGAGSVVTHDVPPGETWAGNPARKMQDKSRDEVEAERSVRLAEYYEGRASSSEAAHDWIDVTTPSDERRQYMCNCGAKRGAPSSSEQEHTTRSTQNPPGTSTSPATNTPTPNSTPANASPATDADALWLEWLESRATSQKRTTLPKRPPGGFIEPSAPHAAKHAPSPRTHEVDL
jgi:acetyltransferase-like isoleucine patch superfamily enzyme